MVGKGLAHDDIIEHLDDTDATAVGLGGEKREHLLVPGHRRIVHLGRKGIVVELHERCKGMPIPEIHRVHVVGRQHVQIPHPQVLVVEPREVLRGVGILVNLMARQIGGLLQAHARAAKHHLRCLGDGFQMLIGAVRPVVFLQAVGSVDGSRAIVADDGDSPSLPGDGEPFGRALANGDGYLAAVVEAFQHTGSILGLGGETPLPHQHLGEGRAAEQKRQ